MESGGADRTGLAEERGELDRLAQLADVAGPAVLEQRGAGVGSEQDAAFVEGEEVLGERQDVHRPRPKRRGTAPRSWPSGSASAISCEIAPQLSGTNGPSARRDSSCTARAATSLPLPLSPRIVIGSCDGAARLSSSRIGKSDGSREMKP